MSSVQTISIELADQVITPPISAPPSDAVAKSCTSLKKKEQEVIKHITMERPTIERTGRNHRRKPTVQKYDFSEDRHVATESETKEPKLTNTYRKTSNESKSNNTTNTTTTTPAATVTTVTTTETKEELKEDSNNEREEKPLEISVKKPPLPSTPVPPANLLHHCHSSMLKNINNNKDKKMETKKSFSPLKYMKSKIVSARKMITNNYTDDSDPDNDTDTDTDSSDNEEMYELDEENLQYKLDLTHSFKADDILNEDTLNDDTLNDDTLDGGRADDYVDSGGHEKVNKRGKSGKKKKNKKNKKGGRGTKEIKRSNKIRKDDDKGMSKKNRKKVEHKMAKLLLYKKAESGLWDEMSGNVKPRMTIKDVQPFTKTWKNYYKCSCVYNVIRISVVVLLAFLGGIVQGKFLINLESLHYTLD
jgi:hypothetical protein